MRSSIMPPRIMSTIDDTRESHGTRTHATRIHSSRILDAVDSARIAAVFALVIFAVSIRLARLAIDR